LSQPVVIEATFQEELYTIPPKPVVAMATPWRDVSAAERVLLDKILGAVKLSLNHVSIITTSKLDVLKWTDKPSHVLAFGLEMQGFNLYEPFEVQGIHIILSAKLSALDQDKEGKQKLWGGLRKVFG
jgi:DNA polymerase III psi subunit